MKYFALTMLGLLLVGCGSSGEPEATSEWQLTETNDNTQEYRKFNNGQRADGQPVDSFDAEYKFRAANELSYTYYQGSYTLQAISYEANYTENQRALYNIVQLSVQQADTGLHYIFNKTLGGETLDRQSQQLELSMQQHQDSSPALTQARFILDANQNEVIDCISNDLSNEQSMACYSNSGYEGYLSAEAVLELIAAIESSSEQDLAKDWVFLMKQAIR